MILTEYALEEVLVFFTLQNGFERHPELVFFLLNAFRGHNGLTTPQVIIEVASVDEVIHDKDCLSGRVVFPAILQLTEVDMPVFLVDLDRSVLLSELMLVLEALFLVSHLNPTVTVTAHHSVEKGG